MKVLPVVFSILLVGLCTLVDGKTDIEKADEALDVVQNALQIGGNLPVVGKALEALSFVGALAQSLMKIFGKEPPNETLEKLKEIGDAMKQLSRKMSQEFSDLKIFITEQRLDWDIVSVADTQYKLIEDVNMDPGNETLSLLYSEYQKNPPIITAYKFIGLLEKDSTNPLRIAMNADSLQQKTTFDKWSRIIVTVLQRFLFVEAYCSGAFFNGTTHTTLRMASRINETLAMIPVWESQYLEEIRGFWPVGVEEVVYRVQEQNQRDSHEEKLRLIRNEIAKIMTNDSFYIVVYDGANGYTNHRFNADPTDSIYSFRRFGSNVVIFRSQLGMYVTAEERRQISWRFQKITEASKHCRVKIDGTDIPARDIVERGSFFGMIQTKFNVKVGWVSKSGYEPGYSTYHSSICDKTFFIAGIW